MLVREVKRRRPKMRVLLTIGYAESSIERVDAHSAEFDLIQKPYKRSELATKVRQVIEGPSRHARALVVGSAASRLTAARAVLSSMFDIAAPRWLGARADARSVGGSGFGDFLRRGGPLH